MTYQEALSYIHATLKFGIKPGLEGIDRLLEGLGRPERKLKYVHVAGTSGKGSISTAVASALTAAGYKTGLYTSPYVEDFCERFRIDGVNIPHDELALETEKIRSIIDALRPEDRHPTEFEIVTAIALDWYQKSGCDIVVLEVGLGGRYDATNIIEKPLVSVIASISYDHTDILGDTLDKIAFEKCGIIKKGAYTISYPKQEPEAFKVIENTCKNQLNPLILPDINDIHILNESINGSEIVYNGNKLFIPLCGRHQMYNFITAFETLGVLNKQYAFHIESNDIFNGFSHVRLPARMEILSDDPLVIIDGAHNPAKLSSLAASIDRYLNGKKLVAVMGMLKDKDYEKAIPMIAQRAETFIAVKPDSPRALEPVITAEVASKFCANTFVLNDYDNAIEKALSLCGDSSVLVICGSFYLASAIRKITIEKLNDYNKI